MYLQAIVPPSVCGLNVIKKRRPTAAFKCIIIAPYINIKPYIRIKPYRCSRKCALALYSLHSHIQALFIPLKPSFLAKGHQSNNICIIFLKILQIFFQFFPLGRRISDWLTSHWPFKLFEWLTNQSTIDHSRVSVKE